MMKNPTAFGKTLLAIAIVALLALAGSSSKFWGPDAAQAATVGPKAQQQDFEKETAIVATNSVQVDTGASITGDVIVNVPSTPPVLDNGGSDLVVNRNAEIDGDAAAETIHVRRNGAITGAVTSDDANDDGSGCPACDFATNYDPPILDLPEFKSRPLGGIPLNVPSGTLVIPNSINTQRFTVMSPELCTDLVIHFTLVMHADMSGHEPAWMPGVIRRENPGDSIDFAQRFAIKHGRPDAPDRGLPPRRRRYTSANVSTR